MPKQSAFLATASTTNNTAVDTGVKVTFDTEVFDQNGDFNATSSNATINGETTAPYQFCAPVTGKYFFSAIVRWDNLDTAADYYRLKIITSNRTIYGDLIDPNQVFSSDANFFHIRGAQLVDMDAGDAAYIEIYQAGGSSQSDVSNQSSFSGYLVA